MTHRLPPNTECEGCGDQIGTAPYLICYDGIKAKSVAFHKRCDPTDPDLQRRHVVTLAPLVFNTRLHAVKG